MFVIHKLSEKILNRVFKIYIVRRNEFFEINFQSQETRMNLAFEIFFLKVYFD